MRRRIESGGMAVLLVLVLATLAACGGSEASASPSASTPAETPPAATEAPTPTAAPATDEPVATPTGEAAVRLLAICEGVAIRTGPTMTDEVLVRAAKLTKVRVVETVTGDPYDAVACGTGGSDWLKIDRINGSSVKKLYGVPFAYAAAGFFE
jgi:hypothetical protein